MTSVCIINKGQEGMVRMQFITPIDGDCLNGYDGEEGADGSLWIPVRLRAESGRKLTVNEIPAFDKGEYFEAKVPVGLGRITLVARYADQTERAEKIVVYRLQNSTGIYRLSSDDNILFLQDINDHKDTYSSIFDNPYLAIYKEAHDKYDVCVQLNIHYERKDNTDFAKPREYFNLSMMTDKFKEEWKANASWLRLSFHSRDIYPNKPYENTTMAFMKEISGWIVKKIFFMARLMRY